MVLPLARTLRVELTGSTHGGGSSAQSLHPTDPLREQSGGAGSVVLPERLRRTLRSADM